MTTTTIRYQRGDRVAAVNHITTADGETIAEPGDIGWVEHAIEPGDIPPGIVPAAVLALRERAYAVHFDHIPHANLSWVAQSNLTAALPYVLMDAVAQHLRHPDTFLIPPASLTTALQPGRRVKLVFEPSDPDAGIGGERMWVTITAAAGGRYAGTLDCLPVFLPLEPGELVEFTSANIIDVLPTTEPKE